MRAKGKIVRPLSERFWEKVTKLGEDDCWLWRNCPTAYGTIFVGGPYKQKRATFVSLMLHGQNPPPDAHICHHCDTPGCVNPKHLFVGTRSDNMKDMCAKGRHWTQKQGHVMFGSKVGTSKLNAKQVVLIKKRLAKGLSCRKIAKEFGVGASSISRISRGVTWVRALAALERGSK